MRKLIDFLKALSEDSRIPLRNRVMLGGMIVYLMTPMDIIPDFIPILGWLDDVFVTLIVLDYVFNSADTELIKEHYPWNKEHFSKMKIYVERLSWLVPPRLKRILFSQVRRLVIDERTTAVAQ
jgi:uncharacterized membrane protein YkvA (DUF1232 family)